MWQIGQLAESSVEVVYLYDHPLATIGEQQQGHMQNGVVAASLVTYTLVDRHVWALALDDDMGMAASVENHYIAPARLPIDSDSALDLHQFQRVTVSLVQHMDSVLAHLFLGRQRHPSAPHGVQHLATAIDLTQGCINIWCFRRHLLLLAVVDAASDHC